MPAISKPIRYVCERCGKRAILGKHFCDDGDVERAKFFRRRSKYLVGATLLVSSISALCWSFAGPYSLLLLMSLPLVAAVVLQSGKPRLHGNRYDELIYIVGGDNALARKLVESARKRYPDKPLPELVNYTIDKLQRDRNR